MSKAVHCLWAKFSGHNRSINKIIISLSLNSASLNEEYLWVKVLCQRLSFPKSVAVGNNHNVQNT